MNVLDARGVTPGARFVDPVVLSRIGNLELVARNVVDGFINGMHRSPYFGASGTGQINAIFPVTPQRGDSIPKAQASSAAGYQSVARL